MKIDGMGMKVPGYGNQQISLPIVEYDMHIYLPFSLFMCTSQTDLVHAIYRYSAARVVYNTSLSNAIMAFETTCRS